MEVGSHSSGPACAHTQTSDASAWVYLFAVPEETGRPPNYLSKEKCPNPPRLQQRKKNRLTTLTKQQNKPVSPLK